MGPVLAVRPGAKSPAASKQVEFVLASVQTADQIAAKCKIPTIAGEVTVELMLEAAATKPSETEALVEAATADTLAPEAVPQDGPAEAATGPAPTPSVQENILRVDAGRIDSVL